MMMKKILIAITMGAACIALPATAQPYIGAGVGSSNTDQVNSSVKVYAGYQLIPNFGFEGAFTNLGDYRGSAATSISLAITGTLPLNKTWDILGKLGASRNQTGSSNSMEPLASFGVGFNPSENISIRLESENLGKLPVDANGNSPVASNVGLSVKLLF
jgi:opacity protein-like surface antigen